MNIVPLFKNLKHQKRWFVSIVEDGFNTWQCSFKTLKFALIASWQIENIKKGEEHDEYFLG